MVGSRARPTTQEALAKSSKAGVVSDLMPKKVPAATSRVQSPRRKFFNEPTEVDGIRFDSKAEAARYGTLRTALRAGEIRDLEVHPRFPLVVHGVDVGDYVGDFAYIGSANDRVVEDVKSPTTRKLAVYRLKVRMLWALYGIRVREIVL